MFSRALAKAPEETALKLKAFALVATANEKIVELFLEEYAAAVSTLAAVMVRAESKADLCRLTFEPVLPLALV